MLIFMQLTNNELRGLRGIIFDFDFTLADSSKGVVKCINYALRELGLDEFSEKGNQIPLNLTALEEGRKIALQ